MAKTSQQSRFVLACLIVIIGASYGLEKSFADRPSEVVKEITLEIDRPSDFYPLTGSHCDVLETIGTGASASVSSLATGLEILELDPPLNANVDRLSKAIKVRLKGTATEVAKIQRAQSAGHNLTVVLRSD